MAADILSNIAAEQRAKVGVLIIRWISLSKKFNNFDSKPIIVIANGRIDKEALRGYRINLQFLLSMLRIKGYSKVSDVEYAIIEPVADIPCWSCCQGYISVNDDIKSRRWWHFVEDILEGSRN